MKYICVCVYIYIYMCVCVCVCIYIYVCVCVCVCVCSEREREIINREIISDGTAHLKNVNNCLNTKIYSYLETSGGQSSNLYLNVAHFFQHQS